MFIKNKEKCFKKLREAAYKLAGLVVIIGVVAFFVTRGTNDSKDAGLDIAFFG